MNLKPLSNHIFVEPFAEEKVTDFGIIIPDTVKKGSLLQGKVVAVGPGKTSDSGHLIPISVKVGDVVLFEGREYDKKEFKKSLIISENDIIAIIEK